MLNFYCDVVCNFSLSFSLPLSPSLSALLSPDSPFTSLFHNFYIHSSTTMSGIKKFDELATTLNPKQHWMCWMRREIILHAPTHVWEFLRSSSLTMNLKFAIWQTNIIIDIDECVACVVLFNHYQGKNKRSWSGIH